MLSRFGKFSVRDKKARRGRNPATGKALTLEARRVVTFHISPVLKAKLNGRSEMQIRRGNLNDLTTYRLPL